ncbi:unnamed protein product [Ilex paraguariensis]|uniref:Uncharacterized protein n=1 Tax=Ilex paraguariensis TaxID=185542 RepID=A0ABC8R0L5_9AQUA
MDLWGLKLVTEEAGDNDLCDVGGMGTSAGAHTHHNIRGHITTKNNRVCVYIWVDGKKEELLEV